MSLLHSLTLMPESAFNVDNRARCSAILLDSGYDRRVPRLTSTA